MKKCIVFLGLVFLSVNIFAQTIKRTLISPDKNLKEEFYVLNTDTNTKQGKYIAHTYYNGDLVCDGSYQHNLKDSIWKFYGFISTLADSGRYEQGKKIGVWTAWGFDKKIQIQYDYTNKKLITCNINPDDTSMAYNVINGSSVTFSFLQRPPVYVDGDVMRKVTIARNLKFPAEAKEKRIGGKVFITFVVNEDGHISDYKVLKSLGYGLDESALNAVKQLTGEWLPGILNGKPVAVEYTIPVQFAYGN